MSSAPPLRLATVVAVCAAVAAAGATGSGLLVPAADDPPSLGLVRALGAAAALVAGAVLVRGRGAGRAAALVYTGALVGGAVCLATLPFSPVDLDLPGDGATSRERPAPVPGAPPGGTPPGSGAGGGATPTAPALPPATLSLPAGSAVSIDAGAVVVRLPDGRRMRLGGVGGPVDPAALGLRPGSVGQVQAHGPVLVVVGGAGAPVPLGDLPLGGAVLRRPGSVDLRVDPRSLLVPVPQPGGQAPPAPTPADLVVGGLLLAFAVVAFAPPFVRLGRRVVPIDEDVDVGAVAEPAGGPPAADLVGAVEAGLASGLRSMLLDPDPRTAVVGAYARVLLALAESGAPRLPHEAPHEHLWRTLGGLGVRPGPVHRLAELFVQARFTPRPLTDAHRRAAVAALADTLADLRLADPDLDHATAVMQPAGSVR